MHQLSHQFRQDKNNSTMASCKNVRPSQTIVHAKLEMTTPGDYNEKEADTMADTVVNGGTIRREISNGSSGGGIAVSAAVESQLAQAKGGGRTMPDGLRNMMEGGFGRDFSNVRIHTDSQAEAMNKSLSAKAFTLGNDIYFNKGQFSPNTREGQHLMAHELTHVIQSGDSLKRKPDFPDFRFSSSCNTDVKCLDANSQYNDCINALFYIETYLKKACENSPNKRFFVAYDIITDFLNLVPVVGGLLAAESKRLVSSPSIESFRDIFLNIFKKLAEKQDYEALRKINDTLFDFLHFIEKDDNAQKIVDTYLSLGKISYGDKFVRTTEGKEIVEYKGKYYIMFEIKITAGFSSTTNIELTEEVENNEILIKLFSKGKPVRNMDNYRLLVSESRIIDLIQGRGYLERTGKLTEKNSDEFNEDDYKNLQNFLYILRKQKNDIDTNDEKLFRFGVEYGLGCYRESVEVEKIMDNEKSRKFFDEKINISSKSKKERIWNFLLRYYSEYKTIDRKDVDCKIYNGPTIGPAQY